MHVEYALTSCGAYIDADIVAIGIELSVDELLFFFYQVHAGSHLFRSQVEKAGDMASRNDHRVARTHGTSVTCTVGEFVFQGHTLWIRAKQTWIIVILFFYFLFFFRRQTSTLDIYD